ncbi:hypothetical protein NVV99_27070, partial [Rhodococcus sp. PAE-6]|nr:hypothetical protein [Rhodococcus sp. PAE-6]
MSVPTLSPSGSLPSRSSAPRRAAGSAVRGSTRATVVRPRTSRVSCPGRIVPPDLRIADGTGA